MTTIVGSDFDALQVGDWFKSGKRIFQKLEPRGLEQRRGRTIDGKIYFFCTFSKVEKVDAPPEKERIVGSFMGRFGSRYRPSR